MYSYIVYIRGKLELTFTYILQFHLRPFSPRDTLILFNSLLFSGVDADDISCSRLVLTISTRVDITVHLSKSYELVSRTIGRCSLALFHNNKAFLDTRGALCALLECARFYNDGEDRAGMMRATTIISYNKNAEDIRPKYIRVIYTRMLRRKGQLACLLMKYVSLAAVSIILL